MIDIVNTKRAGQFKIDGVLLPPGATRLEDAVWERLSGLSYVQTLLSRGLLRAEPLPAEEDAEAVGVPVSLKGLRKSEVERLVAECTGLKQLRAWLDTDGRKSTRELIEARASDLLASAKPVEVD